MLTFLLVAGAIDVANDTSLSASGPGLTFDEGFNVETGVFLVESGLHYGIALLHPASLMEIFGDPVYNPDHPPLGRLVLGTWHAILYRLLGDEHAEQRACVVTYARVGAAFLFACTVGLAAWAGSRWFGCLAGVAAAVALVLIPRVFGHAHLAALETAMGCAYLLAIVVIGDRWVRGAQPTRWDGVYAGLVIGLALLTKIQAILLPPILVAWSVWHWRRRAIAPLVVVGITAGMVFFLGWPWLWLDPVDHVWDYFLSATERQTVYCYYWGERFADRDVPWHYPWVMFLITTPAPLLILLGLGALPSTFRDTLHCRARGRKPRGTAGDDAHPPAGSQGSPEQRRTRLLFLAVVAPLVLFTWPGAAVYDGERLFLITWPPAAILMGQGTTVVWQILSIVFKNQRTALTIGILAGMGIAGMGVNTLVKLHPCQLSYYSRLVGGLKGASPRGFELSYWGDGVDAPFLEQVWSVLPQNATLDVTPVLHPLQLEFMRTQQTLARPDVQLRGFDVAHLEDVRYLLVIQRRADQWEILQQPPRNWEIVVQTTRNDAPLAMLYKITD